jgi:predicted RNA-binding protein with PIN domain
MTYHKEEYTLHNGKKIYALYDDHNVCKVTKECIEMLLDLYQQGRADAIDEFVEKICEKYTEEESKDNYKQYCGEIKQNIADIAEQLKAKEQNK